MHQTKQSIINLLIRYILLLGVIYLASGKQPHKKNKRHKRDDDPNAFKVDVPMNNVSLCDGTLVKNELVFISPRNSNRLRSARNAKAGKYPYLVNIWKNSKFICAGTIITTRWVLTRADCIQDTKLHMEQLHVYSGSLILGGGTKHDVIEVGIHYTYYPTPHTVSMLKVEEKFVIGRSTKVVKIYAVSEPMPKSYSKDCVVLGWGREMYSDTDPPANRKLRVIDVTVLKRSRCKKLKKSVDTTKPICAKKSRSNAYKSYNTDSGGPLICKNAQIGLLSYGRTDCDTKSSVAFGTLLIRAGLYLRWMNETSELFSG